MLIRVMLLMGLAACVAPAQDLAERRAAYREAFEETYPVVRTLEEGRAMVTPEHYDTIMLERRLPGILGLDDLEDPIAFWSNAYDYLTLEQKTLDNENAVMAWGISYDHLSLNTMWRATGDPKYLKASWTLAKAVADARDSVQGKALYTGESAPIWGCAKYVDAGRSVHAVHTGVISFPVLELLILLRDAPDFEGKPSEKAQAEMLEAMTAAIDFHNRQWREGPGEGEGYYVGMNQEPALEGVVLPANRISAMGLGLWSIHILSGDEEARDKAVRIGRYLQNRFSHATDRDAYTWEYSLHLDDKAMQAPIEKLYGNGLRGEDISHGSWSAMLPALLYFDNGLPGNGHTERLANTVTGLIAAEGSGMLYTHIDGMPRDSVNTGLLVLPSRWLRIAPNDDEAYAALEAFILTRNERIRPLDLAELLLHQP